LVGRELHRERERVIRLGGVGPDAGHHVGRGLVRPGDVVRRKGHGQVTVVAQCVDELVEGGRALRSGVFDEAHLVDAGNVRVDESVEHVRQRLGYGQRCCRGSSDDDRTRRRGDCR